MVSKTWLEKFGMAATTVCALHCAVTPFLLLLPLAGLSVLADERLEWLLIGASLALGAINLIPDYLRRHQRLRPLVTFASGVALVLVARLWFEDELHIGTSLAVVGGGAILVSYWINRNLCRACSVCQTTPCDN